MPFDFKSQSKNSGGGFNFKKSGSKGGGGFNFKKSGSKSGGGGFNFNRSGSKSNNNSGGGGFNFKRGGSNSRGGGFNFGGNKKSGGGFNFNRSGSNSRGGGFNFGGNKNTGSKGGFNLGNRQGRSGPSNQFEARIEAFCDVYTESFDDGSLNGGCRFKHILYNVEPDQTKTHLYQCPPFMENERRQWQTAVERNPDPDELVPCPIVGFKALKTRLERQAEQVNESKTLVGRVGGIVGSVRDGSIAIQSRLEQLKRRQAVLSHRLLELMNRVEVLRLMGQPLTRREVLILT